MAILNLPVFFVCLFFFSEHVYFDDESNRWQLIVEHFLFFISHKKKLKWFQHSVFSKCPFSKNRTLCYSIYLSAFNKSFIYFFFHLVLISAFYYTYKMVFSVLTTHLLSFFFNPLMFPGWHFPHFSNLSCSCLVSLSCALTWFLLTLQFK